jgi:hypothetical protein
MKNKFFLALTTLALASVFLLTALGQSTASVNRNKQPKIAQKVLLPCDITNKDAGSRLAITNTSGATLAANHLVYFSTNNTPNPDSGSFKTGNAVAAGAGFQHYAKPQQASKCQAWIFQ